MTPEERMWLVGGAKGLLVGLRGDTTGFLLELLSKQFECNPVYQRYVTLLGEHPEDWDGLDDVIPMPVELYKMTPEFVKSYEGKPGYVWKSSGTSGLPSQTPLLKSDLYDLVTQKLFKDVFGHLVGYTNVSLIPSPSVWPNSSLSHMFSVGFEGTRKTLHLLELVSGSVSIRKDFREVIESTQGPLNFYGTSYAFVKFADACREQNWKVPSGDVILTDTGGYKGIVANRTREEFLEQMKEVFEDPERVQFFSEYGMSELSSAFWQGPGEEGYAIPDWVRVHIDPKTEQLTVFDPMLVDTVAALRTQDRAEVRDGRLFLKGRLAKAPAKGCSISTEMEWSK